MEGEFYGARRTTAAASATAVTTNQSSSASKTAVGRKQQHQVRIFVKRFDVELTFSKVLAPTLLRNIQLPERTIGLTSLWNSPPSFSLPTDAAPEAR